MKEEKAEFRLQTRELQLNSLFELIRAINDNAPEEHLYRLYKFIFRTTQSVSKLALYVYDEKWECKISYDTTADFTRIPLSDALLAINQITTLTEGESLYGAFGEFDQVIPVKHKTNVLAYVFLGFTSSKVADVEVDFIATLSNIMIVAIENKKLVRRELKQETFKQQLAIAKDVQSLLFPKKLPYNQRIKVVASYQPHHSVGGDYYDFIPINKDKFLLCIADVSGKGVPAAILMSNFQAALRILVRKNSSLQHIVEELNHLILSNARGENFITAFFVEYDVRYKTMTYINAGHNPPFMITRDKQVHFLSEGTTVLGGFEPMPFLNISTINSIDDFMLFCFTDGFIETYNDEGEPFGVEQLRDFILANRTLDQKELHERLISLLNTFRGEQAYVDDITLLSLSVSSS